MAWWRHKTHTISANTDVTKHITWANVDLSSAGMLPHSPETNFTRIIQDINS